MNAYRAYNTVMTYCCCCCCCFFPRVFQVGIVGAGRIGAAYARMMVEGHKMNLVYYDPYPNTRLEEYIRK
jgi:lactate dehydrogenase-like 2-hydroxyacid dehydrogenase